MWAPLAEGDASKNQATVLLQLLNLAEGQKAINPWWDNAFWSSVASPSTQYEGQGSSITVNVPRLPDSHGYVGPASVSPPRDTLRKGLEALRDTGAPLHGAGMGALPLNQARGGLTVPACDAFMQPPPPGPTGVSMVAGSGQGSALQQRLPPDLRRAAPEIYHSLRSQGSASTRDWLNDATEHSKMEHQRGERVIKRPEGEEQDVRPRRQVEVLEHSLPVEGSPIEAGERAAVVAEAAAAPRAEAEPPARRHLCGRWVAQVGRSCARWRAVSRPLLSRAPVSEPSPMRFRGL